MRLTVTTFLSLDGVYQSPGGPDEDGTGYAYGGWTAPYGDENLGKFITAHFANADAFLLGRKTYEIFAGYWPRVTDPDNPVAAPLNSLRKHVVTSTLTSLNWNNSTPVTGDLAEEVGKLNAQPGNELQVHGSGRLAQALIAGGLVDELRLMIFPVILGTGKQFFPREPVAAALRLASSQGTSTGVTMLTLRPDGPARLGTVGEEP
jgi:dihydrofolate reductase